MASAYSLAFIARASALMALLYGAHYYPYASDSVAQQLIAAFLRAQALAAGALIGLFDRSAGVQGAVILGAFPVEVVRSCSSLDAQALYVATVLASPARWGSKLLGLGLGLAALTALNVGRIASLYFVGANAPGSFDAVHEELFPLLLVAAACACFVAWLASCTREPERRAQR